VNLLAFIEDAFSARQKPKSVVRSGGRALDEDEEDALAFADKTWQEVTCTDLAKHTSAVFHFTPEAFCYFLPGIYSAGIRESRANLLVNDALIGCLDRSNMPNSWDDFFAQRWPKLNVKECEATIHWLLWLAEFEGSSFGDARLSRSFDTVNLLIARHGATPLAGWSGKR
jgi:hypothetical protein